MLPYGRHKKKRRHHSRRFPLSTARVECGAYLSALDTLLNVLFNAVPSPLTVAMMATATPAAIKPYSIAVTATEFEKFLLGLVVVSVLADLAHRVGLF